MLFVFGFILGLAAAYFAPVLQAWRVHLAPKETVRPADTSDDTTRRRTERAIREYRNFMTYDGYAQQDDQP